jgi:hypothetical protein
VAEEQPVQHFIISASGDATEDDALAAFEDLVGLDDSVGGSIVIAGVSHDASEFREEAAAPAPTPLASAKTGEAKSK